jgi:hypothetical protein
MSPARIHFEKGNVFPKSHESLSDVTVACKRDFMPVCIVPKIGIRIILQSVGSAIETLEVSAEKSDLAAERDPPLTGQSPRKQSPQCLKVFFFLAVRLTVFVVAFGAGSMA